MSSITKEYVEFLLKGQETKMKTLVDRAVSRLETLRSTNMSSFTYDITKVKNVAHERHEIFEKRVTSSKDSIELNIKYLVDLDSK